MTCVYCELDACKRYISFVEEKTSLTKSHYKKVVDDYCHLIINMLEKRTCCKTCNVFIDFKMNKIINDL